ncbi:MAG: hypothetical protein R3C44_01480 [Chloroflexota bacterium]
MRKTFASKLMITIALLTGLMLIVATVGALALDPTVQGTPEASDETLPQFQATPLDINNPDIPPLETGGPAGEIVVAKESPFEINSTDFQDAPNAPTISVWYGNSQSFGSNGDPQKWVNILGTVNSALPIASLSYSLNGGSAHPLSMGADDRRLAQTGDFNIELDYTELQLGSNQVVITAIDSNAASTQANVTVQYTDGGNSWPAQTYTYSWQGLTSISEKAQIVDGQWVLDNGTIRPTVFDFDRLVALGDLSGKDYTA